MTNQELFDKVASHLRKQNKKSVSYSGLCRLRFPEYDRDEKIVGILWCAIGCLIPDSEYNVELEQQERDSVFRAAGLVDENWELAMALQELHDSSEVCQWKDDLLALAALHNLQATVLEGW